MGNQEYCRRPRPLFFVWMDLADDKGAFVFLVPADPIKPTVLRCPSDETLKYNPVVLQPDQMDYDV